MKPLTHAFWPLRQLRGCNPNAVVSGFFVSVYSNRTPHVSSAPESVAREKRHGKLDTPVCAVPACQRGTGVVGGTRVELPSPPMNESLPPGDWGRAFCLVWVVGGYPPLGDLQGADITGASAGSHVLYWLFSTTE